MCIGPCRAAVVMDGRSACMDSRDPDTRAVLDIHSNRHEDDRAVIDGCPRAEEAIRAGRRGFHGRGLPPILKRRSIDADAWELLISRRGFIVGRAMGRLDAMRLHAATLGRGMARCTALWALRIQPALALKRLRLRAQNHPSFHLQMRRHRMLALDLPNARISNASGTIMRLMAGFAASAQRGVCHGCHSEVEHQRSVV